jgi:hypothetical protein
VFHFCRNNPVKSICFFLGLLVTCITADFTHADSATWNLNPISSDWHTAANWTPPTVPDGPADDATFALSNTTTVTVQSTTTLNSIIFDPGASAFTISMTVPTMTIGGPGIVNNSGVTQNFVC